MVIQNFPVISLFILVLGFLEIAPVRWMLLSHFAPKLSIKMSLKQVARCLQLFLPLFSTSHVMAMLRTKRFQNWWMSVERQEVRCCPSCK